MKKKITGLRSYYSLNAHRIIVISLFKTRKTEISRTRVAVLGSQTSEEHGRIPAEASGSDPVLHTLLCASLRTQKVVLLYLVLFFFFKQKFYLE